MDFNVYSSQLNIFREPTTYLCLPPRNTSCLVDAVWDSLPGALSRPLAAWAAALALLALAAASAAANGLFLALLTNGEKKYYGGKIREQVGRKKKTIVIIKVLILFHIIEFISHQHTKYSYSSKSSLKMLQDIIISR